MEIQGQATAVPGERAVVEQQALGRCQAQDFSAGGSRLFGRRRKVREQNPVLTKVHFQKQSI